MKGSGALKGKGEKLLKSLPGTAGFPKGGIKGIMGADKMAGTDDKIKFRAKILMKFFQVPADVKLQPQFDADIDADFIRYSSLRVFRADRYEEDPAQSYPHRRMSRVMMVRNGYFLHSHRNGPFNLNTAGVFESPGKSGMQMTVADHCRLLLSGRMPRRGV